MQSIGEGRFGFRGIVFDGFEPAVEDEGAEGEEGGDRGFEPEGGGPPGTADGDFEDGEDEQDEEAAVNGADEEDGLGEARQIFERHGDAEEDEVGDAFEEADEPQSADGGVEHGKIPCRIEGASVWGKVAGFGGGSQVVLKWRLDFALLMFSNRESPEQRI